MSIDPSPLKDMGTQSQETVAVAAALAEASARSKERADAEAGSRLGDAAGRAAGMAKDALRSAAEQAQERAARAVASYTRDDPLRAVLIAAGTGALLMGLLAMMARSGVRAVRRRVQG